jgi:hypothetical protein
MEIFPFISSSQNLTDLRDLFLTSLGPRHRNHTSRSPIVYVRYGRKTKQKIGPDRAQARARHAGSGSYFYYINQKPKPAWAWFWAKPALQTPSPPTRPGPQKPESAVWSPSSIPAHTLQARSAPTKKFCLFFIFQLMHSYTHTEFK